MTADASSAPRRPRLLVFIVAFNAEKTIESVITRIPLDRLPYETEILIIDDQSADRTFARAREAQAARPDLAITVLSNPVNQGYGGNQKIGYHYAIQNGFDAVALLHGDGQYAPEMLPELVEPILRGEADAVFGTRMAESGRALKGGMPLYKYVGNRILTAIENRILGMKLTEFHSGYRVYSVPALARVPFHLNTNDFHFDTEIIIQFQLARQRFREIPIPTYYGDEICHVNGISYAVHVIRACLLARLQGWHILYQRQFDIREPAAERYPLKLGYASSHTLAVESVPPGSNVLDIGCGSGALGRLLVEKGCRVRGIESVPVEIECGLTSFAMVELNRESLVERADEYDYILMLDVIEHLDQPTIFQLLDHIRETSRARVPTVLITTSNIAFLFIRLQLLLGHFNYGKRGILDMTHRHHFTFRSLRQLLVQSGYQIEMVRGIPPPIPAALGDSGISRFLMRLFQCLGRLSPGLFAYQILIRVRPKMALSHLLDSALHASGMRSR